VSGENGCEQAAKTLLLVDSEEVDEPKDGSNGTQQLQIDAMA